MVATERREPRDGLRVVGDADPSGGGVRRARQRRHPARAHAGAGGAHPARRAVPPSGGAGTARRVPRGGGEAALANFPVAAKTGTARRVVAGHYAAGEYTASFAALFPADQPQLVLVVKIDNPHKGSYFAAQTAAPVTRSMLEQALSARTVALDRARLSTAAPRAAVAPADDDGGLVPYVVPWPYQPDSATAGSMVTLFADPHAADRVRSRGAGPARRGARR